MWEISNLHLWRKSRKDLVNIKMIDKPKQTPIVSFLCP